MDPDEREEPGPGPADDICDCGCESVALYLVDSEDELGPYRDRPCCQVKMRALAEEGRMFGYPFISKSYPKPLVHTCPGDCAACTLDVLRRAKSGRSSPT